MVVAAVSGFYLFYRGFVKQEEKDASSDSPSLTIVGPDTATSGQQIVMTIKNTGNMDFTSYVVVQGHTDSGGPLKIGAQASFSTTLSGSGPWVFMVEGRTAGDKVVEDGWSVEPA